MLTHQDVLGQAPYRVVYEQDAGSFRADIAVFFGIDNPDDPEVRSYAIRSTLTVGLDLVEFKHDSLIVANWPEGFDTPKRALLWYHDREEERTIRFSDYSRPNAATALANKDLRSSKGFKGAWRLLDETKEIIGHETKRAQWVNEQGEVLYDIWYALKLKAPYGPVMDIIDAPGLVLEMTVADEVLFQNVRYTAVSLAQVEEPALPCDVDIKVESKYNSQWTAVSQDELAEARQTGEHALIDISHLLAGKGWMPFSFPHE